MQQDKNQKRFYGEGETDGCIVAGVVEEINGGRTVKFLPIPGLQGHKFVMEMELINPKDSKSEVFTGPFRIEYVLGTEFLIFLSDLSKIDPNAGFSLLRIQEPAPELSLKIWHSSGLDSKTKNEIDVKMTFKVHRGYIQRVITEISELDLDVALRISGDYVSNVLDSICFRKRVPLQIHCIEVYENSGRLSRRYITVPYLTVDLDVEEFKEMLGNMRNTPKSLMPYLRLFREAINSSNPHYRLLNLYKITEHLTKLRDENIMWLTKKGIDYKREDRRIPDNDLTQKHFNKFIGKKYGAFLDNVKKNYRVRVAHLSLNEYCRMPLDTGDVGVDHELDITNTLLILITRQIIEDESNFMLKYELDKIYTNTKNTGTTK